jgi:hypothetical protein
MRCPGEIYRDVLALHEQEAMELERITLAQSICVNPGDVASLIDPTRCGTWRTCTREINGLLPYIAVNSRV